ncbi:alpha/beta hydrolase fold domain-containing protein, partial [Streptomyces sp. NPDC098789]|uniref:alpha/beta hydrolase fold domain-containing protein n=1 Tax=Streptomyces sp. NPDC098789 TaxID=3366098 RepID=UPI00382B6773
MTPHRRARPEALSPRAREVCAAMSAHFPPPGDAGALRAAVAAGAAVARPGPPVAAVRYAVADGVPVRVYDPAPAPAPGAQGRPLVVYFHGGGWVMCGPDTHDATCRTLAARSGAVVVSADYRLAPEHPWPAAPDDALTVLLWARARAGELGCDPAAVVVAGDSSG